MSDPLQDESLNEDVFSWEKWFLLGLHAFKKTLRRYNFGLPDEFWEHLEKAFAEFLSAMRIAMHAILARRHRSKSPAPPPKDKTIDIQWDEDD